MFSTGEVNRKCEFTADGDETARDVSTRHRARVPCIEKEQDCLKSHTDGITFVAHDFRAFCEVVIDSFDDHWVVICAG